MRKNPTYKNLIHKCLVHKYNSRIKSKFIDSKIFVSNPAYHTLFAGDQINASATGESGNISETVIGVDQSPDY